MSTPDSLIVHPHPLAEIVAFDAEFPRAIGDGWPTLALPVLLELAPPDLPAVDTKEAVRALLRAGGFKPSGRSKPASEYVAAAVPEGRLGPINAAVDACNAASFRGGLPISVVDLDRVTGRLSVDIAPMGSRYVFNASGQELDLGGLLALFDEDGPCANAVKDSQRTKTHDGTRRTRSVIWGTRDLPGRAEVLARWYAGLLADAGATVLPMSIVVGAR